MHDALNGTDADAELCRDLLDAFALEARGTDPFLDALWCTWPAQGLALCPGSLQSGLDPLADHRAFELGKYATHLKHGFAGHGRGIDALLVEVQIDALGLEIRQ